MNLVALYPQAKWVVGNCEIWRHNWFWEFIQACYATPGCIMPKYWGLHIYTSNDADVGYAKEWLESLITYTFPRDSKYWITEFADTRGKVECDIGLVKYFESAAYIERYSYFTNRAKGDEIWYPPDWNVQLFDWDTGEPTMIGRWYIQKDHHIYFPIVTKSLTP
jgi:hypothetical protein